MDVIDEQGRLFGVVNVVDALVVLLVLAVVVAGIALVDPFGGGGGDPATEADDPAPSAGDPATRYATIDLGERPVAVAEDIEVGDLTRVANASDNLTITDVYVTPGSNGNASVVVRTKINGRLVPDQTQGRDVFEYGGARLTRGRSLTIDTPEYTVAGAVVSVGESNPDLPTTTRSVLVQSTVSPGTARAIERTDSFRIGGRDVATVESVTLLPGSDPGQRLVFLGLTVDAIDLGGGPRFAGTDVRLDAAVPFRTDDYVLSGTILQVGATAPNTTRTRVVVRTTVPTTIADSVAVGDRYRIDGTTVGTVESVRRYPTGDRSAERLLLGLTLRTVERGGTAQFGARELRLGTTVRFTTDSYALSGDVIHRGNLSLPGEEEERTVTLKLGNVSPELANSIAVGMTETRGDMTIAEVVDKRVEPAEVVLTSEDGNIYEREHPRNKDVYLTVRLQTRRTPTGLEFHARPLQSNTEVVLDLGSVTVRGTVIEIESE